MAAERRPAGHSECTVGRNRPRRPGSNGCRGKLRLGLFNRRTEGVALQLVRRTEVQPAAPDPLAALSTRSLVRPYSTRMPDDL